MSGEAAGLRLAVAAALVGAGFVAGLFPIFDGDIFWHLAAGRWIVEHGAVPLEDPFRFSAAARPWVDHEWLFQVVVFAVERAVGLDGVVVVRAAALGAFGLVLFVVGRGSGCDPGLRGLIALGAVLGVRPRFLDRPEIVTLFAIVALLAMLERSRAPAGAPAAGVAVGPGRVRGIVAPAALVVVWVNFHGEALLAPVLAGLFAVGSALDERTGEPAIARLRRRRAEILGMPAVLALALLANPYGARLLSVPWGIRTALADLGALNPEWLPAHRAPQPYLFGGMAVVLALAVAERRASGHWVALRWALPAAALAVLALGAVRHQALFYAAAAPFVAHALGSPALARGQARLARRLAVASVIVSIAAAGWAARPPASGPLRPRHGGLRWGVGLAEGRFPVRMTALLEAAPAGAVGPLYNELLHGGWLLWRLHPPRRVFVDGRMELEPALLGELVRARRSAREWAELLRRRGATGALVRYETRRVPVYEPGPGGSLRRVESRTANDLLFPPELWELVEWDDEAMLFLVPGRHAWPRPPYRHVRPEDPERLARLAAADPGTAAAIVGELRRKLAEQPDCRRARTLLDAVSPPGPPAARRDGTAPAR